MAVRLLSLSLCLPSSSSISSLPFFLVLSPRYLNCLSDSDDPIVTLIPSTNTCIRSGAPQDVSYTCESSEPTIIWRVATRQLVDPNEFVPNGITVAEDTGSSNITFNTTGRDFVIGLITGNVFDLTCLAGNNEIDLEESAGATVMIVVYGECLVQRMYCTVCAMGGMVHTMYMYMYIYVCACAFPIRTTA